MPKIKIVFQNYYDPIHTCVDPGDWEYVSDEDLAFLQANMQRIEDPRYVHHTIRIIIQDEVPIQDRIDQIKAKVLVEEEEKRREEEKKKISKENRRIAREKKQLEKLQAKYNNKP